MKTKAVFIYLFFISVTNLLQAQDQTRRLRREDCFFGVHFDLHASEDITDAGKTLTPEMVDSFLTKVKPDFIQIDCKGHPGISSYPTKIGYPVKSFEKDPLKLWREVTKKNKVGLYMHYSGVWDNKMVKEHPGWAVINANGERSRQKVSFFSPYLDTYLIPQLKELSDYGVDGVWIDGDNWAVERDYCEASLKRFAKETGITDIPRSPADKHFSEFTAYTRSLFREYLNKYVDAIHRYNPDFQITSNWAYSSMMPEKVTIDLDFLSGDLTAQNAVYQAAFEARCLAPQGKPWDLMAWGFSWSHLNEGKMPRSMKSAIQLKQEAAQCIAMGGGFQIYYTQNRDLSIKPWIESAVSGVGEFCRERQPFCHKAKPIPQIALLYPSVSYLKNAYRPYSDPRTMLQGALNLVLDGQNAVEILMEHHLQGKMEQYPLIIIPECDYLAADFLEELKNYVSQGGNLMVIGTETAKIFKTELGIKELVHGSVNQVFVATGKQIGSVRSASASLALSPEAEPLTYFYETDDFRQQSKNPSASMNRYGKGKITGVYLDAASAYAEYRSPVLRDFVNDRILELFSRPLAEVKGSHLVHLAVNELNKKIYVNLINIAGEHTNPMALGYDEIPPLRDLKIDIHLDKKPEEIILQPGGKSLNFKFSKGTATIAIPELEIHSILEILP
ncbi:MAG: hypothetical protein AAGU19_04185 [Prolixibacteraceae bacterium]